MTGHVVRSDDGTMGGGDAVAFMTVDAPNTGMMVGAVQDRVFRQPSRFVMSAGTGDVSSDVIAKVIGVAGGTNIAAVYSSILIN